MHYLVWFTSRDYDDKRELLGIFEYLLEANNYAQHLAGNEYICHHGEDGTKCFVRKDNYTWWTQVVGYGPLKDNNDAG